MSRVKGQISKRREVGPLTSEEVYKQGKEDVRRRNALNRRRGRDLETRIAKKFGGRKVSSSGSGVDKGDNSVLFKRMPGDFLIECKATSAIKEKMPTFRLMFEWIDKIRREAKAMRSYFGIVVFHHIDRRMDFVIIHEDDIARHDNAAGTSVFSELYNNTPLFRDISIKGNKQHRNSYLLPIDVLIRVIKEHGAIKYKTTVGTIIIVDSNYYIEALNNEEREETE